MQDESFHYEAAIGGVYHKSSSRTIEWLTAVIEEYDVNRLFLGCRSFGSRSYPT
jgi:hypothetical protein